MAVAATGVAVAALVVTLATSGHAAPTAPAVAGGDVPLVDARPLAPAGAPAPGQTADGIPCGPSEQLRYHVHARLRIFVGGSERAVPLGVGIGAPVTTVRAAGGQFAAAGSCFALLHTHRADGIIHVESPQAITYVLEQFFAVWGQRLDATHVGSAHGRVTAFVDGRRYPGDPRTIPLAARTQIQLDVGRPVVPQRLIPLPESL